MSKKILLRIVIVLAGIWLLLIVVLYFSGNSYKEHALKLLQNQLDEYLTAEIHIPKEGIEFSIVKNFPSASLQLKNILIKSSEEIDLRDFTYQGKDTLLFAGELSLLFNLKTFFTGKYELKKIVISDALINILEDHSGHTNYLIIRQQNNKDLSDSVIFQLRKIYLNDAIIRYFDAGNNLDILAETSNSELEGVFSNNDFDFHLKSSIQKGTINLKEKSYLNNVPAEISISISKTNKNYTFDKGIANIFGTKFSAWGAYDSDRKYYQFIITSDASSIKDLTFPEWETFIQKNKITIDRGSLSTRTKILGYSTAVGSEINSEFILQNAGFRNRNRDIIVRNIYLKGKYYLKANGEVTYTVDSLSFFSDESEVSGSLSIVDGERLLLKGKILGTLELRKLMLFESIARRMELGGKVKGEILLDGPWPDKEKYASQLSTIFKKGDLVIQDGYIRPLINPLPAAFVSGIIHLKGIQEIWLEDVQLKTGESDLLLNGSVSELPLLRKRYNVFPVYRCEVISNEFHVEDFINQNRYTDAKNTWFQLPDSMIVYADLRINNFYFGKFSAQESSGKIIYQPKLLRIKDLTMKSQKGQIFSDIEIEQESDRLVTTGTVNFQKVDIGDVFYAFNNFGQQVILDKNIDGILSGTASLKADWDFHLGLIQDDLELQSAISIENGELIEYQPLLGLSKFIEVEELSRIKFDKLQTSIHIEDRVAYIPETHIISSAVSLVGSGEHDFENNYRYRMQVQLSDILWNKAKKKKPENSEFGYIVDDGLGKTTIPLIIEGKDTDFKVYYDKEQGNETLRTKVQYEKEEFKRLFQKNEYEKEEKEQDFRLEWEEETKIKNTGKKKDTSESEEDTDQDFVIEWDDD